MNGDGSRVFGWDYPAGAENDPRAPWNQVDPKCERCGLVEDDCTCKPCRKCGRDGQYLDEHDLCEDCTPL